MDLANFYSQAGGFGQGQTITFTGALSGGGTVSQSYTLTAGDTLQSLTFSGFTDVTSVTWNQDGTLHQFDNVVVNASTVPALAAAVSFALMALRRRRKASSQRASGPFLSQESALALSILWKRLKRWPKPVDCFV